MADDNHNLEAAAPLPCRDKIDNFDVNPEFLEKLPLAFVKRNLIFPLNKMDDNSLSVAIASPKALFALDDLGRVFNLHISPVLVPAQQILDTAHRFYNRLSGSAQEVVNGLNGESLETIAHQWDEPKDLLDLTDEAPIIKLLNSLLFQAVKERASDIHIEPFERGVEVR